MAAPAIRVEQISKLYRIGAAQSEEYQTLRDTLARAALAPARRIAALLRGSESSAPSAEDHWALRDVSFDVQPGEVVGIVGRNGAGKSTLLKILTGITEPTSGRVQLRGRVGSLLEVGTGFHPELTGRENIFLNGAILGMTRVEIRRKFDEIVAFAEIDRFLDTPVKRYSSGMHIRLGFAVAAHLNPEILLVDEVLAVGDAAFQKKCLGKMDEVSHTGRTILFVSHNMAAVKSLCTRGVLLEGGRVACEGSIDEVVDKYLLAGTDMSTTGCIPDGAPRIGNGKARFRTVRMTDDTGRPVTELYYGQPLRVTFACEILEDIPDAHFEVSISALDGTHVVCSMTGDGGRPALPLKRGLETVTVELDVALLPRQYSIDLAIHHDSATIDLVQRTLDFTVLKVAQKSANSFRWTRARGYVAAPAEWHLHQSGRRVSCRTGDLCARS
jgi:lipopolysaccharide transport system ATP-binding protein